MRKFLMGAIPVITLALFVLVMLSGNFLKMPLGTDDNIPDTIDAIIESVQQGQWEEASGKTDALAAIWKKVVRRIQYSSERDEINFFNTNLARLKGAVLANDKTNALMELKEAYDHWVQLGN